MLTRGAEAGVSVGDLVTRLPEGGGVINHVNSILFCFMDIPGEGPVKACVDHVSVILIVKISLKYQNISVCVNGF